MTVGITELPPEGMQLGGVALAGDPDRGTKTTEGLSLLFTTAGITVQGPQPQIERLLVWSGLDSAACSEKTVLPDGRDAGVMELTSGGQTIRFLLPTENVTPGQAAYLDQALPAWLKRYKETASPPLPPPPAQVIQPAPTVAPPPTMSQTTNGASPGGDSSGSPAFRPGAHSPAPPTSPPPPAQARNETPLPPPPTAETVANPRSALPPLGPQPTRPTPPPPPPGMPAFAPESPVSPPSPPAPPPPPAAASAPQSPAASPPPPPAEPAGSEFQEAPAVGTSWDNPPLGQIVQDGTPAKKRGWRKSRDAPLGLDPGTSATETHLEPPAEPPADPVPLVHSSLPAPTFEVLSSAQRSDGDAAAGMADSDKVSSSQPELASPAKGGWRRKSKVEVASVAGGAATAGALAATETGSGVTGDEVNPSASTAPVLDPGTGPEVDGPADAGPAPVLPPSTSERADTASTGIAPEAPEAVDHRGPVGDGEGAQPGVAKLAPSHRNNRPVVVLLLVLLLVVIGGIAYFAVKKNHDTTTDNPLAPSPTVSPVSADSSLATSINLRRSDLPTGWAPTQPSSQVARPPVAPAAAQVTAQQSLATCIGGSYPQAAGIFGDAVLPGQTDSVRSPTFQDGSDTTFQLSSTTTVMSTAAEAQALTTSFANPNLATCLGQYQSSLVSAAMPGATAQVQMVTLPAPPGVSVVGYLTTLTLPNEGTEVIGQAFLVGGRVETKVEPTTSGEAVPGGVFTPAYNAVAARVGAQASK